MAEGFRVDLEALQQAADGVNGTLDQLSEHKVSDIDRSAFGHDHLGDTVADFGDRWQRGVENLAKDGREIAGRLTDSVRTYRKVEEGLHDHLQGILQRFTGPDPAAP
jgi:hypothetical protein